MPFFLGNTRLWEVLFLFEIFLNVIVLLVVLFIPETPTYLASQNAKDEKKHEEDVTKSLVFFREIDEDDARLKARRRIIDSYQCSQIRSRTSSHSGNADSLPAEHFLDCSLWAQWLSPE
ncbi:unnamed protein product [Caenorhabditis nigoni]